MCKGVYAYLGSGLSVVGSIGMEVVLATQSPVFQGGVFPACAVGVIHNSLVGEDCGAAVSLAGTPSPYAHCGKVVAQCAGMACCGMVHITAFETDGHSTRNVRSRLGVQHIVLCTVAQQQRPNDGQQICIPMFLHKLSFLFFLGRKIFLPPEEIIFLCCWIIRWW